MTANHLPDILGRYIKDASVIKPIQELPLLRKVALIVSILAMLTACGGDGDDSTSSGGSSGSTGSAFDLAITTGDGYAKLTWDESSTARINAVAGECTFYLFMASESSLTTTNWSTLNDGATFENISSPYTVFGLTNDKTYYFLMKRNCSGVSTIGTLMGATIGVTDTTDSGEDYSGIAPDAVNVTAVTEGQEQVKVTWDAPNDLILYTSSDFITLNYLVHYEDSGDVTIDSPYIDYIWAGLTSYTVTGLTASVEYCFAVTQWKESIRQSPFGVQMCATPTTTAETGSPTNLAAVSGDGEITLTWDALADATSYNVYWATLSGVTTEDNRITSATSPHKHTGLVNGTTYYYVVTAETATGETGISSEVFATASAAPTNVSVTVGTEETTITWDAVSSADSYNIYWNNSGSVTTSDNKIADVTSPYSHSGLTDGSTYYYIVTATVSGSEGPGSTEVSAGVGASSKPTNVSVTTADGDAIISWDAVSGADSYNIYWSTTAGVTTSANRITGAISPYTQTGLTNGSTYYYAVSSITNDTESGLSSEVSVTVGLVPTGVTATAGWQKVELVWSAVTGATSYNLYWNTTGSVTTSDNRITGVTSPYTHTGLTDGTTYYYVMTSTVSGKESAISAEVSATP